MASGKLRSTHNTYTKHINSSTDLFLQIFTEHLFGGGGRCFPGGSADKESACNVGEVGLIPGLGRSPGEGVFLPGESQG